MHYEHLDDVLDHLSRLPGHLEPWVEGVYGLVAEILGREVGKVSIRLENMIIAMSAYSQHRDPCIFPRQLEFIPERWLENVTPEIKLSFVPFSTGSRYSLGNEVSLSFSLGLLVNWVD